MRGAKTRAGLGGWLRQSLILASLALALVQPRTALAQISDCSVPGQNAFVRGVLRDIYYWYRELPDPDPAGFASPDAYLEAVRYRALDTTFSYVGYKAADNAFYSASQFIGFGFGTRLLSAEELRVSQVFPESPASEAGLERGDQILEINGRSVADWVATGELASAFGPSEVGVTVEMRISDERGRVDRVSMVKRLVTIPTVSLTRVYDVDGRRVGYVFFRNFVEPSIAALDAAFAELRAAGATELVLDLRYNGGGLVSVAQHLAGLIGGETTVNQVFAEFFHNDKNAFRNHILPFEAKPNALPVPRLLVITTRASASASELVINSLRPFLSVAVIGDATYGKPVGQYGFSFCDRVLYPVAFTLRNARGEGDYFGGLPPDCAAADDLGHELGDLAEASLAEALGFVRTGACSAGAAAASRSLRELPREPRQEAWQVLLGAH